MQNTNRNTPTYHEENAAFLIKTAVLSGITERKEIAHFMVQMQVESGGFRRLEERFNYSADRLLEVFGPRRGSRNGLTSLEQARAITAGGQERIAAEVYGGDWGRKNLGNLSDQDAYAYRGRGFVQLTGRAQY